MTLAISISGMLTQPVAASDLTSDQGDSTALAAPALAGRVCLMCLVGLEGEMEVLKLGVEREYKLARVFSRD